jgi:hypothetical protein
MIEKQSGLYTIFRTKMAARYFLDASSSPFKKCSDNRRATNAYPTLRRKSTTKNAGATARLKAESSSTAEVQFRCDTRLSKARGIRVQEALNTSRNAMGKFQPTLDRRIPKDSTPGAPVGSWNLVASHHRNSAHATVPDTRAIHRRFR